MIFQILWLPSPLKVQGVQVPEGFILLGGSGSKGLHGSSRKVVVGAIGESQAPEGSVVLVHCGNSPPHTPSLEASSP